MLRPTDYIMASNDSFAEYLRWVTLYSNTKAKCAV